MKQHGDYEEAQKSLIHDLTGGEKSLKEVWHQSAQQETKIRRFMRDQDKKITNNVEQHTRFGSPGPSRNLINEQNASNQRLSFEKSFENLHE